MSLRINSYSIQHMKEREREKKKCQKVTETTAAISKIIGRVPHWGFQSRFCVIYIICMNVFDCLWENNTKKLYAKMRGRNYVVQTRACSKISFGSLKRSADYNFRLEFVILPLSGRLKLTGDILIIHFYYMLEQL